jgi:hypothetical protein
MPVLKGELWATMRRTNPIVMAVKEIGRMRT